MATYCKKCSDEVREPGLNPADILDKNRKCMLCGEPKICPACGQGQDEILGDLPLTVCMDCIGEGDRYMRRIDEVNQNINSTLRLREAEGWTPDSLVFNATMAGSELRSQALKPGLVIKLEPVPIFAVAVLFKRGTEARLDPVELCPASMRRHLLTAFRGECLVTGVNVERETPKAEGRGQRGTAYDDIFQKTDGIESVVFLLTELKNGNVKAELITNSSDSRLFNPKKAFALIRVDHFRVEEVHDYTDDVGTVLLLKPRAYNRLTAHGSCDFFTALATANTEVILAMSPDLKWCTSPEEANRRQEEVEYEELFGTDLGPDGLPIDEPDEADTP